MVPPRLLVFCSAAVLLASTSASPFGIGITGVEARSPGFEVASHRRSARALAVSERTSAVERRGAGSDGGDGARITGEAEAFDPYESGVDGDDVNEEKSADGDDDLEEEEEDDEPEDPDEEIEPPPLDIQYVGPDGRRPTRAEIEGVVWDEDSVARMMFGAGDPGKEVKGSKMVRRVKRGGRGFS